MELFTIGFTKKTASEFFGSLRQAGVTRLVDVRLNNVSQLAGFAKRKDLEFFCKEILAIGYVHNLALAPDQMMLDEYKKNGASWDWYEKSYRSLLEKRAITFETSGLRPGDCLLCSEHTSQRCHRRVVLDYLAERSAPFSVCHL